MALLVCIRNLSTHCINGDFRVIR